MNPFYEKLTLLWPEIIVLIGAIACLVTGLWDKAAVRKTTPYVAMAALFVAGLAVYLSPGHGVDPKHFMSLGAMVPFFKYAVLGLGIVLVMVAMGTPDRLKQIVLAEARQGKAFEPGDDFRAEFFAFMLFSLTGAMLCAGASDLVWLFLALELTSLPTYVLVAISRDRALAQEAAVKYFFLGALSAAIFLYGFALIYGATGFTEFAQIADHVQNASNGLSPLFITGLLLAVLGVCFKIAAVPMHFYTADVYEGAATPVTAFLAFVPKAAGFMALIALLGLAGWGNSHGGAATELPEPIVYLLALIAVLTMTIGNVLGLMQERIKRVLAYSSIAHSGYMLVGLLVGPAVAATSLGEDTSLSNGIAAVLFYLVAYGLSTISSFALLSCMSRPDGSEVETYDDLSGMRLRHPWLAGVLLVCVISLVGLPPLVGFVGKLYLIGSAFAAADNASTTFWVYRGLVIAMVINSAMSAGYYLRIASVAFFGEDRGQTVQLALPMRVWAASIAAGLALLLGGWPSGDVLVRASRDAAQPPVEIDEGAADTQAPTTPSITEAEPLQRSSQ